MSANVCKQCCCHTQDGNCRQEDWSKVAMESKVHGDIQQRSIAQSDIEEYLEKKISVKRLAEELQANEKLEIPAVFFQPPQRRPNNASIGMDSDIPVISFLDLHGQKRALILQDILKACQTWGFFQIVDHGIPEEHMKEIIEAAHNIHDLPEDVKMTFNGDFINDRVFYEPSGCLRKQVGLKWSDNFYVRCYPSPPQNVIPQCCLKALVDYSKSLDKVAKIVVEAIKEILRVPNEEEMIGKSGCVGQQTMTLRYYPPCPRPDLILGLEPHCDTSTLTFLLEDDVGGLQIFHQEKWMPVKSTLGAIIVNVGDMLEVMSNGKFKSVNHRVVINSEKSRVSVAAFYSPSPQMGLSYTIAPLPHLINEKNPPLYKGTTFANYLSSLLSRKFIDGMSTLDPFRISSQA